jgi:5-hydroxyisourate hydrolase-like protein (transthyretin family)
MKIALRRVSGARLATAAAAVVLLMLLLAVPAMAAPAATSVTASPNLTIVDLGDSHTISAVLMDTDSMVPLGGELLWVEQAPSSGGPWSDPINVVTNDGDNGEYSAEVLPEATTYYRFVYLGTAAHAPSTSNVITVLIPATPPPYDTSLTATPDQTTVVFGDSATISAELTDTDNVLPAGGQEVLVQQAASTGGPWLPTDSVTNDGSSGEYSLDVAPTTKTHYRFVFEATDIYLTSTSNIVTVDVVPAPTTLTASPGQASVVVGGSLTISAVLTKTQGGAPVGGRPIRVEQAASTGGPWSLVQAVTNDATTGVCSLAVNPSQTTYYRFVFEGAASHAAATSNVITVQVASASTSLTASPGETTVIAGGSQTLSATLMDTSHSLAVGGAQLRVEQATSTGGPWSLVQTVTNGGTTGDYSLAVTPTQKTYYRFVFEGTATYASVTSNTLTVKVQPTLAKPTCPASVKKGKTIKVKGTVQPGAPSGPVVKVQTYRKLNGKWSKYKSAYTTSRSGANYSVKIKIKATGKFKFKATVATSASFEAATSSYTRVLTVKK